MDEKEKEIENLVEMKLKVPDSIFNKSQKNQESNRAKEVTRTERIVKELHDQGLIKYVEDDVEVQKKIMNQVEKSIDTELSKIHSKGTQQAQEAAYDANQEACKNFGVPAAVDEWKIKMMRWGSSIWFVIYYIIAMVTIVPISVFTRGIDTFLKRNWLSVLLSTIIWIFISVGLPLLIKYSLI
jgi:hypothetical protein